jgi:predicted transcriptional regulator
VPTAQCGERVSEVHARAQATGWNICSVENDKNQVLGRLRRDIWNMDPNARVEEVMEEGPTTFRPNNDLEALTKRMQQRKVGTVLITNPEGVLIGVLYRQDAERRLSELKNAKVPAGEKQ